MLAAACHGNRADVRPLPTATTVDKVWQLESSGAPVRDTAVQFAAARGRTVVLRHAAPDDALFLVLQFPAVKDSAGRHDSVQVTLHQVPGKYGFTLMTPGHLPAGTQATFSYAIHFQTPGDAVTKYPNPARLEVQLSPAEFGADNKIQILSGVRPAADMIRFTLSAPGTYGLVAIR